MHGHKNKDAFTSKHSGQHLLLFVEPPSVDPHVRWCGKDGQQWRPYPISLDGICSTPGAIRRALSRVPTNR